MFHTTCWIVWLFDSVPPEEWQILVYLMKSTFKFGQPDTSLKTLFQNVHIYILVSPKNGMTETFFVISSFALLDFRDATMYNL